MASSVCFNDEPIPFNSGCNKLLGSLSVKDSKLAQLLIAIGDEASHLELASSSLQSAETSLQNKKMTLAKTESSAVMIQNKVNVVSSKIEFLSAKKPIFEAKIKEIKASLQNEAADATQRRINLFKQMLKMAKALVVEPKATGSLQAEFNQKLATLSQHELELKTFEFDEEGIKRDEEKILEKIRETEEEKSALAKAVAELEAQVTQNELDEQAE